MKKSIAAKIGENLVKILADIEKYMPDRYTLKGRVSDAVAELESDMAVDKHKDLFIEKVKGILNNTDGGTYFGGSLVVHIDGLGEEPIFLNVSNNQTDPELRYLLAKVYLKYKTSTHAYYKLSEKVVKEYEVKNESNI